MSETDRRRHQGRCGNVVRILSTVAVFTIAMTFVWFRSGRWKGPVHRTAAGGVPLMRDGGLDATRATAEQERVTWTATPEAMTLQLQYPAEERVPRHRGGVVVEDDRFAVEPTVFRSRDPMFVAQGKLIKKIPYPVNRRGVDGSAVVDQHRNNDPSRIHKMNIRLNHRQINNYDYPAMQKDEPIADKDKKSNNQNAYDLTYEVSNKEENKNSVDESGRISSFGLRGHYPDNKHFGYRFDHDASRNPKIPEAQLMKHFSPTFDIDFMTQPNLDIPAVQKKVSSSPQETVTAIPTINEVFWRRMGFMALIKLGLVKLKAIGFTKMLFLLLLKLKFVLIVLFFKFISLFKFIKFLIFPLFFLPLAAIIYPMLVSPAYTSMMNILDIDNNLGIFSNTNTPIPTNNEFPETFRFPGDTTRRVPETQFVPSGQTILVPGESILIPGGSTISGQTPTQVNSNPNFPPGVIDGFNFLGGQRYEPLEVSDPTLEFFQKELNSEKCVERIACKIAATGKTGIIPLWINWLLHRVSESVPNDQLLYYLKAYDDVNNEIHMKSPNPDNWETWCFERYDCSSTNLTDTR